MKEKLRVKSVFSGGKFFHSNSKWFMDIIYFSLWGDGRRKSDISERLEAIRTIRSLSFGIRRSLLLSILFDAPWIYESEREREHNKRNLSLFPIEERNVKNVREKERSSLSSPLSLISPKHYPKFFAKEFKLRHEKYEPKLRNPPSLPPNVSPFTAEGVPLFLPPSFLPKLSLSPDYLSAKHETVSLSFSLLEETISLARERGVKLWRERETDVRDFNTKEGFKGWGKAMIAAERVIIEQASLGPPYFNIFDALRLIFNRFTTSGTFFPEQLRPHRENIRLVWNRYCLDLTTREMERKKREREFEESYFINQNVMAEMFVYSMLMEPGFSPREIAFVVKCVGLPLTTLSLSHLLERSLLHAAEGESPEEIRKNAVELAAFMKTYENELENAKQTICLEEATKILTKHNLVPSELMADKIVRNRERLSAIKDLSTRVSIVAKSTESQNMGLKTILTL